VEIPVSNMVARSFQEHMARSGNTDLVRNIKFILKDNSAGEIKLILKPESLGNVRITLNMQENNIAGRIIVDNQSIKDDFLNNMNQLNQILRDNGFEDAALDVFVGQQDQPSQDPQDQQAERDAQFISRSLKNLDEAAPVAMGQAGYNGSLNMVI
jgi:flagellar protein FlbC